MALNNGTNFNFEGFGNYTIVPNAILNDNRLSYKALGVYVQIIQFRNSENHVIYKKGLVNCKKDGNDSVKSALDELCKFGYMTREYIRNERGQMQGVNYTIFAEPIDVESVANTTIAPKTEKAMLVNATLENTLLKNKIDLKQNIIKQNNDDDDASAPNTVDIIINKFKSYNLGKVMPHVKTLFEKYADKISVDVIECIFIKASESDVNKKYAYIKTLLENFDENGVYSMIDLEQYYKSYKESKAAPKSTTPKAAPTRNLKQPINWGASTPDDFLALYDGLDKLEY